jgi:hypothetical protein
LLKNLDVTMDSPESVVPRFGAALKRYPRVNGPAAAQAALLDGDDDGDDLEGVRRP